MSMAHTTPAQKPRGLSRSTDLMTLEGVSSACASITGARLASRTARFRPWDSRLQSRLNWTVRSIARMQILEQCLHPTGSGQVALARFVHCLNGNCAGN